MTNSDDRFHADLVAAVSRANADTARRALRFSHDLARALGDGVSQVEVGCYSFGEDAEIRFAVKPPGTAGSRVEVTVHRNGVRMSVDVASVDVPGPHGCPACSSARR